MRRTLMLLTAAALAACARGEDPGTETPQGEPRVVNAGSTFELRMHANESTGYHWELAEPLDSLVLADRGHRYLPSDASGRRNGAGGMEVWRFEALAPGRTAVALHYRRGRDAPAEARRYPIEVR